MLLCKAISILKKEIAYQFLRISVCQKVLGKTVKVGKVGNIIEQIRTVHIASEAECVLRSAREKVFDVSQDAIKRCFSINL